MMKGSSRFCCCFVVCIVIVLFTIYVSTSSQWMTTLKYPSSQLNTSISLDITNQSNPALRGNYSINSFGNSRESYKNDKSYPISSMYYVDASHGNGVIENVMSTTQNGFGLKSVKEDTTGDRGLHTNKSSGNSAFDSSNGLDKTQLTILSWPYAYALKCTGWQNGVLKSCPISGNRTCTHVCDEQLYNRSDLVLFNICSHREYPSYRPNNQKWVYIELEAPPQTKECWTFGTPRLLNSTFSAFNISSTFTEDSDVPYSINKRCKLNDTKFEQKRNSGIDYLANKTRNVAWFVSHCTTQSRRETYTKELKKYIDVDVYGKCGNLTCASRNQKYAPCSADLLNNKYRFYLSFENSLCQEYLTEKVGRVLDHSINTIPIVMGHVNYSDYFPMGTFIDVKDYPDPKELALYLYKLANNSQLYNEYIYKKYSMDCKVPGGSYLCRLCQFAHANQGKENTLPDIREYWSLERRCINPSQYLPGFFQTV